MEQVISHVTAPTGEDIACATVGDGPVLVLAAWWTSHLEYDWQDHELRSFVESLAQRHTVVRYDRPGVGLSGRVDRPYNLDAETSYLRSVVEATGVDQVDLMGISCGGPASIRLAVEDPERVGKLVLFASYLNGNTITDDPTRKAVTDLVRANWGLGSETLTGLFLPGAAATTARRFSKSQRRTASAEVAANLLELTFTLDATEFVGRLDLPVLVMHRAHDRVIDCRLGRELAQSIPGATYEELEGRAHIPWTNDCTSALKAISSFLSDGAVLTAPRRQLATVCFLDIVDSTQTLAEIGDSRWRERLDELATILTEEAATRGGAVVKDTGDGAMLTFDLPGDAIEFSQAVRARAKSIGLALRCGLHMGEIELRGDDITGIAVVAAARVADIAEADQIVVTRTVADLVAGSAVELTDHGLHQLRGVPGEWPLLLAATGDRVAMSGQASVTDRAGLYKFTDCVLDVGAFELRRGGEIVHMEPQVFDVLRYLVENRGGLVSKEQLLDDIWGDRFVGESALSSRIRSARLAVGDDGQRQEIIRTVHGRGYRFVAELV